MAVRRLEGYEDSATSYGEEPSLRREIVAGIAVAFLAAILAASVFTNQLVFQPRNALILLLVVAVGIPLGLLSHALTRSCQVFLRLGVYAVAGAFGGAAVSVATLPGTVLPTFVALGALAGGCAGGWAVAVARHRGRFRMALGMMFFASFGPLVVYQFV